MGGGGVRRHRVVHYVGGGRFASAHVVELLVARCGRDGRGFVLIFDVVVARLGLACRKIGRVGVRLMLK